MKDRTQERIDKMMDSSPILNKIGADGRKERDEGRRNTRDYAAAENSNAKLESADLIAEGHTQHIGTRPHEGISQMDAGVQGKLFDTNTATNKEGGPTEPLKKSFEAMGDASKEHLDSLETTTDQWKVDGLVDVKTGNPTTFNKDDFFTKAIVEKLTDTNPETQVGWGNPISEHVSENVNSLIDALHGNGFADKINSYIEHRFTTATTPTNTPSKEVVDKTMKLYEVNMTRPIGDKEAYTAALISHAVMISLLRNPENTQDIMSKLAKSDELDFHNVVPDFKDIFQEVVLQDLIDRIAEENQDFFDPSGTDMDDAKVKSNRQKVKTRLLGTDPLSGLPGLALATGSLAILPSIASLEKCEVITGTKNEIVTGDTELKVNSKANSSATGIPTGLGGYKNSAFRGLHIGFPTGKAKEMTKLIAKTMSIDPTNISDIFKDVFATGLKEGSDTTSTSLKRMEAMVKAHNALEASKTIAGLTATNLRKIESLQSQIEEFSTPEGINRGIQRELFEMITNTTGFPTNPGLLADIQNATEGLTVDTNIIERLSTIAITVSPESSREEIFTAIRAITNIEILKEFANEASDDPIAQRQYLMALTNRFILKDGEKDDTGAAINLTPEQLVTQLTDLLYGKTDAESAFNPPIKIDGDLESFLAKLLPSGTTLATSLAPNGLSSTGSTYSKAHELLGITRRAVEASEWMALSDDTERSAYLVSNFGLTAGSPELVDALGRFNEVRQTNSSMDIPRTHDMLPDLIAAAIAGDSTNFGDRYTNLMRMHRHYIENGGDISEIMRNAELLQANSFIQAIQEQANPELGVSEGGVMTENNRVMTIEEQRATMLEDYEALEPSKGIKKWISRVKKVAPRIAKGLGFIALGFVGAAIPAVAGPLAIGFGVMRAIAVFKTAKAGIGLFKQAKKEKNWKMAGAAALGIGVNVAIQSLVPGPWSMGIGMIGEALGLEVYADRKLLKEGETVRAAHGAYETAMATTVTALGASTDTDDLAYLQRLGRSINVDTSGTPTNIAAAILSKRTQAHAAKNMTLLRSFSQVMEEKMKTEVDMVNKENNKARKAYSDAQQNIMAYSVASAATKLGYGITRGFVQGNERAGFFGGLAGAAGWAVGGEQGIEGNGQSLEGEIKQNINALDAELESDYAEHADELGIDYDDNEVMAIVNTDQGHYAAIDTNNDGDPETLVKIDNLDLDKPGEADLNFSKGNVIFLDASEDSAIEQLALATNTPVSEIQEIPNPGNITSAVAYYDVNGETVAFVQTDDGFYQAQSIDIQTVSGTGGSEGLVQTEMETIMYAANSEGDSQWTLVEQVLRKAYPGHTDQEYYRVTANTINEAGTEEVYTKVYAHRVNNDAVHAQSIQLHDELSLQDIHDMAPNAFASMDDGSHTGTIANPAAGQQPSGSVSIGTALSGSAPAGVSGVLFFNSPEYGIDMITAGDFIIDTSDSETIAAVGMGETTQPKERNALGQEWDKFTDALSGDRQQQAAGATAQAGNTPTGASNIPNDNNSNSIVVNTLGNDFTLENDLVNTVRIPQKFGPDFIIDPELEIVSITDDSVTYIDANDNQVTKVASGPISLSFNENPDDFTSITEGPNALGAKAAAVGGRVGAWAKETGGNIGDWAQETAGNIGDALTAGDRDGVINMNVKGQNFDLAQDQVNEIRVPQQVGDDLVISMDNEITEMHDNSVTYINAAGERITERSDGGPIIFSLESDPENFINADEAANTHTEALIERKDAVIDTVEDVKDGLDEAGKFADEVVDQINNTITAGDEVFQEVEKVGDTWNDIFHDSNRNFTDHPPLFDGDHSSTTDVTLQESYPSQADVTDRSLDYHLEGVVITTGENEYTSIPLDRVKVFSDDLLRYYDKDGYIHTVAGEDAVGYGYKGSDEDNNYTFAFTEGKVSPTVLSTEDPYWEN